MRGKGERLERVPSKVEHAIVRVVQQPVACGIDPRELLRSPQSSRPIRYGFFARRAEHFIQKHVFHCRFHGEVVYALCSGHMQM